MFEEKQNKLYTRIVYTGGQNYFGEKKNCENSRWSSFEFEFKQEAIREGRHLHVFDL